jgi:hypothetical protein
VTISTAAGFCAPTHSAQDARQFAPNTSLRGNCNASVRSIVIPTTPLTIPPIEQDGSQAHTAPTHALPCDGTAEYPERKLLRLRFQQHHSFRLFSPELK